MKSLFFLLVFFSFSLFAKGEKREYKINDCHLHLVDFLQHEGSIFSFVQSMNEIGIDHVIAFGLPYVKKWDSREPEQPFYYLVDDARCYWYSLTDTIVAQEILKLSKKDRQRFHPMICGFNPTDRNAIEHVKRMFAMFPNFWEGIGEILTRHDDLTALVYGETARANHIALDPIYEFAAEKDLPVFIHSNIGSVWRREPIYLNEIEEVVKKHPKTRFVWCHAGISRRILVPSTIQHVRRLLSTYSNLFVDLSWEIYDLYLVKEGKPDKQWLSLEEEFPDRFLIGSDQVGHSEGYKETLLRYFLILDALKPQTAKKIAHENFLKILPKKK